MRERGTGGACDVVLYDAQSELWKWEVMNASFAIFFHMRFVHKEGREFYLVFFYI